MPFSKLFVKLNYRKLKKIILEWGDYSGAIWNKSCNEDAAQNGLKRFFNALERCSPDKKLDLGTRTGYYSFLINFIPLKRAIENKQYALACHELETLMAYEPVLQERIYYNLIRIRI